jgi:hypothetical protein
MQETVQKNNYKAKRDRGLAQVVDNLSKKP